jgi:hypothetical protein
MQQCNLTQIKASKNKNKMALHGFSKNHHRKLEDHT